LTATGAYSCALELQQDPQTDFYIGYVMAKVQMLQRNNITPVLVFDGASLPMKVQLLPVCNCIAMMLAG
jgi:5'-3' exonuclease